MIAFVTGTQFTAVYAPRTFPGAASLLCKNDIRCRPSWSQFRGSGSVRYLQKNKPMSMSNVSAIEHQTNDKEEKAAPYDPSGMTVEEFFRSSVGSWKSQRSSHNLAWTQFEAVTSDIAIVEKPIDDPDVVKLCESNKIQPSDIVLSIEMSWKGESDWDDEQVIEGRSVMSVIKDTDNSGRLLRSAGYAETIPAVGNWIMTAEGSFVLNTFYDMAAAEERIWFATPDLRLRVSNIRTSSGRGVVTASFSSEIRTKK